MSSSSSPPNPPSATTPRPFSNPPPPPTPPSLNKVSNPSQVQQLSLHNYQKMVTRVSPLIKPRDPPPAAMANPGGFPPSSYAPDQTGVPNGYLIRPIHLQQGVLGSTGGVVKGISVSSHPKAAASPSLLSNYNGHKDVRDGTGDDSLVTIRDRKVRISDGASLYAQCRSWLKNGISEESQPQYPDGVKFLPRPLPIPVGDANSTKKREDDNVEEDVGDVDQLSSKELLQKHIKRAKRVRARLREERLQRIARYKTRLALLLPPHC